MSLGYNRVLGDPKWSPANRLHRVALSSWPTTMLGDPRTACIESLLNHVACSGYEGTEFFDAIFALYYPDVSLVVAADRLRNQLDKLGLQNFGATLHDTDEAVRKREWLQSIKDRMDLILQTGGQYVSVQFFLHPDYLNTGGLYRNDEDYLRWVADRVVDMRTAAWDKGLNFYLEVHIDRVTEDPQACCRLLELASCQLNGDMSHLLYRAYTRGKHVEKILSHVGHTHVRLCRQHGDLSAWVDDPKQDWAEEGITWQMFQFMKKALDGGLCSRTIAGESGPMHLVKDTLSLDASLVPLYRAMARYADASAQGIVLNIEKPEHMCPWG